MGRGEFHGRVQIPAGVTLFGDRDSVIRSKGLGTTVTLTSSSALLGLTVDGSGGRFDVLDAAVKVSGTGARVEGVTVRNSVFGVLVERAKKVRVIGNRVHGVGGSALGMRGDGIRLWETDESLVEANWVEDARDCVVWYSRHNRVLGNKISRGRYGVHLMYSHRNEVRGNRFESNEVGVFAMYSDDLAVEHNEMLGSIGAAGMGLGLKESSRLSIRNNRMIRNSIGVFTDNSPIAKGDTNRFERNEIRLSDVGMSFLGAPHDVELRDNRFADNFTQVRVEGGGDALSILWAGNLWDDYAGYDLDDDGVGDVPYELDDLSSSLEARYPDLAFLRGTLALAFVSVAGRAVPLLATHPMVRDATPRVRVERAN